MFRSCLICTTLLLKVTRFFIKLFQRSITLNGAGFAQINFLLFYLQDVVVKGDAYYNTGDVLLWDTDYYVYFVDRVGDTFRYVQGFFKFLYENN